MGRYSSLSLSGIHSKADVLVILECHTMIRHFNYSGVTVFADDQLMVVISVIDQVRFVLFIASFICTRS